MCGEKIEKQCVCGKERDAVCGEKRDVECVVRRERDAVCVW